MIFNKNKSLVCYEQNSPAKARLFCFPCAGSGASMFRRWSALLPDYEIWGANYPGRETLHDMAFASSVDQIIALFCEFKDAFLDKPCVFYGHSFGALIAFKTASQLEQANIDIAGICVGARRSPHLPSPRAIADLPKAEFIDKLKRYGGLPDAIRNNKDMMDFYLPIIRADLELNDHETVATTTTVTCPIHLYSGLHDQVADEDELAAWRQATQSHFTHKPIDGGHFFIQNNIDEFMAKLNASLATFIQAEEELIAF